MKLFVIASLLLLVALEKSLAATKSKKHIHEGVLQQYDNHHIPYKLTANDLKKLEDGEPVTFNERNSLNGRGTVIQDVQATPLVCMDRIRDFNNYHKMVPKVKRVEIYEEEKYENGTVIAGAEFQVGISLFKFGYFLKTRFEPKYFTLTWTLDYRYNSDLGTYV